jgi:putative two-component system response regulator
MGARILLVDDDPAMRAVLRASLEECDYEVIEAGSGDDALSLAHKCRPAVLVADVLMPGMDGFELCTRVRRHTALASLPVILCSAAYRRDIDRVFALDAGANSFVAKEPRFESHLISLIAEIEAGTTPVPRTLPAAEFAAVHADVLALQLTDKVIELERANDNLRQAMLATVNAMHRMLAYRDPYTLGHQQRVGDLAMAIARRMGLDEQQVEGVRIGGYVHDVGKVNTPSEILTRSGRLKPLELGIVREHAVAGHGILCEVNFPWPVAQIALQHHERLDGSGYPNGLQGEEIILEARVVAVADVVEAMSTHRPYRAALGQQAALAEIRAGRGRIYDAAAVDACVSLLEADEHRFD